MGCEILFWFLFLQIQKEKVDFKRNGDSNKKTKILTITAYSNQFQNELILYCTVNINASLSPV